MFNQRACTYEIIASKNYRYNLTFASNFTVNVWTLEEVNGRMTQGLKRQTTDLDPIFLLHKNEEMADGSNKLYLAITANDSSFLNLNYKF